MFGILAKLSFRKNCCQSKVGTKTFPAVSPTNLASFSFESGVESTIVFASSVKLFTSERQNLALKIRKAGSGENFVWPTGKNS